MKVFKEILWQFQLLLKCFRLGFIQKVRIEIHKQTPTLSTKITPAVSHDKCCPSAASAAHSIPACTTKPTVIGHWELWKYHAKQFLERLGWGRYSFASQLSPQPAASLGTAKHTLQQLVLCLPLTHWRAALSSATRS